MWQMQAPVRGFYPRAPGKGGAPLQSQLLGPVCQKACHFDPAVSDEGLKKGYEKWG